MPTFILDQKYKVLKEYSGKTNGTCLQGFVVTTYDNLKSLLGRSLGKSGDGKVTAEWILEFEDGTIATIYNWKTGKTPKTPYRWHIGGKSKRAVECVEEALQLPTEKYKL